jgi:hypothetical protein
MIKFQRTVTNNWNILPQRKNIRVSKSILSIKCNWCQTSFWASWSLVNYRFAIVYVGLKLRLRISSHLKCITLPAILRRQTRWNIHYNIDTFIRLLCFWTNSRSELNSKIYIRATYFDKKNEYGLQTRTDSSDTIIDNIKYRKFQIGLFTDYSENKTKKNILRNFTNSVYCLLDNSKKVVHKINYQNNRKNKQELFSANKHKLHSNLLTRNSFPRDSLVPTKKHQESIFKRQFRNLSCNYSWPAITCCFKQRTLLYQTVNGWQL